MATHIKLNRVCKAVRQPASTKNLLCTSALLTSLAFPAMAEENVDEKADQDIEVIQVQGLRGTMTRSLNEKKNSVAIVDSVASADFGELPGLSLSDVIENISGASGHREKGSQNEISIRGLGSYWGYATFNGRTITNAGPGRAVNFKKFPSELVDKVNIYKSQQADLVEGGTSGTIEVASRRAVDFGKSQTTIEATGIYNSYYSDVSGGDTSPWGNKIVFSTIHSMETENFGDVGFSFGVNHTQSANPEENFGGSSQMGICALRNSDNQTLNGAGDCTGSDQAVSAGRVGRSPTPTPESIATFDESSMFYVPNDAYWRTNEDTDTRTGAVATFQWVPNDQWDINADFEFSDLEYTEQRMELGLDTRRRNLSDHIIADDHTLLYSKGEARIQLTGEDRNQVDEYRGGGINFAFMPTDELKLSLDLSYSESYRYRLRHRTKLRTDDRHNYSIDFRESNVPVLTFLDSNRNGPTDAGFNETEAFDPTSMANFMGADGTAYAEYRRNHEHRNDDILAVRFDAEYLLDNKFFSAIRTGVRLSEENLHDEQSTDVSLTLDDGSQRYGSTDVEDNNWDDTNPEAHLALMNGIIDNCSTNHVNNNLFQEENGSGGQASQFATYDHKCFIGQMLGQIPSNNGDTSFYDIGERDDLRSGDDRIVNEKITAAYIMADIDTEIGDIPVIGNVGVRVVKTETHSDGYGDKIYITTNEDGTFNAEANVTGEIESVDLDSEYTKTLPSLNLTFMLTDEFYLRFAAYRSMSRFQMNAMSSGISFETCQSEDDSICDESLNTDLTRVITGAEANGNHMNPYMATNFDVSAEYYPSEDAAITLALYNKSFVGGYEETVENRTVIANLDGVDIEYPNVMTTVRQTSDDESTIRGFELTAQKHFVELPEPFDGLGVKFAYNYAESDFVTPEVASAGIVEDANLFGFSKNVASGSIYWEGEKTTIRLLAKHRSPYFQPNNLPFSDRSHRYVQDQTYIDFSAKYKVTKGITVFMKGLNLLNQPKIQTRGNDTTIADYSRSGSKFEFGIKAKF